MRVLVTGADGYLGRLLVTELERGGHEVSTLDAGLYRAGLLEAGAPMARQADTRELDAAPFAGQQAVVHLAELSNDPLGELDSDLTVEINHRASVRLADLAAEAGVERFVYFSSCSVYGATGETIVDEDGPTTPLTTYARCKVAVEQDLLGVERPGLTPVILRNATVYGPSPALRLDLAINEFTYDAVVHGAVSMRSAGTSAPVRARRRHRDRRPRPAGGAAGPRRPRDRQRRLRRGDDHRAAGRGPRRAGGGRRGAGRRPLARPA